MEQFLALSPLEKGLGVAGLLALALYSFVKLLGKRKRIEISIGSPNEDDSDSQERPRKTSSTDRLEMMELEWRREVEGDLREVKRELFEPDRAVRGGDHKVRNEMAALVIEAEKRSAARDRELKADIRAQLKEFKEEIRAEIRAELSRGNCCEHCP